jgi:hypothetical protein
MEGQPPTGESPFRPGTRQLTSAAGGVHGAYTAASVPGRTGLGSRGSGYLFGVRRIRAVFLAGVAGLTLAACGGSTTAAPPPIPSTTSAATTTTVAPTTTAPTTTIPAATVPTTAGPTTTAPTTTVALTTTVAPTTVATPPTTAAALSICEPSQLNINLAPRGGEGGNQFFLFDVVNISQQACPIGGYFGVSIYNPVGQLASATDDREVGPSGPSQALELVPGATASFSVGLRDAEEPVGNDCPPVGAFHLIPPNATTDVQVSVPAGQIVPGCNDAIIVRPVAAGPGPVAG